MYALMLLCTIAILVPCWDFISLVRNMPILGKREYTLLTDGSHEYCVMKRAL